MVNMFTMQNISKSQEGGDRLSAIDTKRMLIEETYQMILEVGAENIRVRELTQRVHLSAAAIYKHFPSLDYLISMASVYFLQPYIKELELNASSHPDFIVREINAWKLFNKYAFQNPYIFLNLFWQNDEKHLELILQEYFTLYPFVVPQMESTLFYTSLSSGNIEMRDYIWFCYAATLGRIRHDDAVHVSRLNSLIARGLLTERLYDYKEAGVYEKAAEECNRLIEHNIRSFMLDDVEE